MSGTLQRGLKQGLNVTWTLGKVIFPITLFVTILQHTPVLPWIIDFLRPVMGLIGLSGEAAVPLVLGNALNLFAGIAAIISFDFTVKEVFIMAVMLSFCHNLFIESTVAAKVGVNGLLISAIRLVLALTAAVTINLAWSGGSELANYGMIASQEAELTGWGMIIVAGLKKALGTVFQLAIIVIVLMVIMQYLREKGFLLVLSNRLEPVTKLLGMNRNTSMTLVTGLTIGLAYGAGLMIHAVQEEGVSKKDMYLAMLFLVACHAVVEDTVVFIPLGIPVWPLLLIRLVTAIILTITVAFVWNRVDVKKRKEKIDEQKHERSYDTL